MAQRLRKYDNLLSIFVGVGGIASCLLSSSALLGFLTNHKRRSIFYTAGITLIYCTAAVFVPGRTGNSLRKGPQHLSVPNRPSLHSMEHLKTMPVLQWAPKCARNLHV